MTDLTNLLAPFRKRVEAYRDHGTPGLHAPQDRARLLAALEGVLALAARDRPESMEAARAKVRADRRAAQAEAIRAAQEIAWAKGATSAGANLMELQASGINPNPYRHEPEESFADRMARRSIEALHAKYPQGRPE